MGVTKRLVLDSGVIVDQAYFRIRNLFGDSGNIQCTLDAYISREAFLEEKANIHTENFSFQPNVNDDALNFYRQGYAYLKENDNYIDAEDVLEDGQSPLTQEEIEQVIGTTEAPLNE